MTENASNSFSRKKRKKNAFLAFALIFAKAPWFQPPSRYLDLQVDFYESNVFVQIAISLVELWVPLAHSSVFHKNERKKRHSGLDNCFDLQWNATCQLEANYREATRIQICIFDIFVQCIFCSIFVQCNLYEWFSFFAHFQPLYSRREMICFVVVWATLALGDKFSIFFLKSPSRWYQF